MAPSDSPRTTRLCRWWLLGTPLLLAVTYPLWLPVRTTPYLPLLPIPTPVTDAFVWTAIASFNRSTRRKSQVRPALDALEFTPAINHSGSIA